MGLFSNLLGNKNKEKVQIARGYFITEINFLQKKELTHEEFEAIMLQTSELYKPFCILIKNEAQDFFNTVSKFCTDEEAYELIGLVMTLWWLRTVAVQAHFVHKQSTELVNVVKVFDVIHNDVKKLTQF